jgi:hypothetical protein
MQPSNNNNFDFFRTNQSHGQQNQPQVHQSQAGQLPSFFSHLSSNKKDNSSVIQSTKKKYKVNTGGNKIKNNIYSEIKKKKSDSVQEVFKSVLGEYEIIRALGKGSYGAVAKVKIFFSINLKT